jgi:phosphatidate cytidylyltransferase
MENNLKLRIISSIILLSLLCFVLYIGSYAVYVSILVISVLSYQEFIKMTSQQSKLLQIFGLFIIILPNASLIYIYINDKTIFLWLLVTLFSNDVFAYFIGRNVGGYRLMPVVSPNKTWSGFFGGIIGSIICGGGFALIAGLSINFIFLSAIIAILGTAGDLFESLIKRCCHTKDSGDLIPGHGGLLDRVDCFIFSAPFTLYILF